MNADAVLTLRDALPADRAFLLALYASTRAGEFDPLGWSVEMARGFVALQFEAQRGHYEHQHPGATCQVVEQRRGPVGRLWVAQDARCLTVLDISVVAERRGQGIGAECLRRVLRRAATAGLDVELQVVHGNPARRLYERLGFRPVGQDGVREAMAWQHPRSEPSPNPSQEMHHEQA